MESIEIEKRYRLKPNKAQELLDKVVDYKNVDMADYYVPNDREHMDLRVRKNGDKYCITRKFPISEDGTTIMKEITIDINEKEFEELTNGIKTSVEKNRYKFSFKGKDVELDIFKGRHSGLCILEVEFYSEEEMNAWLSTSDMSEFLDVTADKSLAGGNLAKLS